MKRFLLAAVAAAAIASPAAARDGSGYIGIEGGLVLDADSALDLEATDGVDSIDIDNAFEMDFNPGADIDLIAGYDMGMIRLEAELGYKRMKADEVQLDSELFDLIPDDADIDFDAKARVWSVMGNALFDFANFEDTSLYAGAGIGFASVKMLGDTDSGMAWQLIAGARTALTSNLDAGIKYRFFNARNLNFSDDFEDIELDSDGFLRSHSILVSLIYNFGAAAAPVAPPPAVEPPPPPPPAPATQTCPDGSVILATDACPPPPPPPPPAAGERG